ncbi:hypothetical protein C8R44DRAFT_735706 [Mycena epipterygia]|nr:hypothetical protein C8R44DRAFT_735706 [Mycena epipterygia]
MQRRPAATVFLDLQFQAGRPRRQQSPACAFDYGKFYNNIVDYFEFPPGPRARAEVARLLDWWNTNVFGTTPQWSLYEGGSDPSTSSVAVMRAARVARETEV